MLLSVTHLQQVEKSRSNENERIKTLVGGQRQEDRTEEEVPWEGEREEKRGGPGEGKSDREREKKKREGREKKGKKKKRGTRREREKNTQGIEKMRGREKENKRESTTQSKMLLIYFNVSCSVKVIGLSGHSVTFHPMYLLKF